MTEDRQKSLKNYNGADRVVTSHELQLSMADEPETRVNVKSFIPGIDCACQGFRGGELYTISGPTKNGKTLFAQTLTVAFAKQYIFPTWFSFEVPVRQFLSQFHGELPMIYMPAKLKPRAMQWFEDRVYESFEKYGSRIFFIDHLHYLIDLARQGNISIEIGAIIRRLKSLTINGDFLIFLLCHTTKGKLDGALSYENIRDSSFVSQESDSVIMIKRTPEDGDNTARARIEFHRRTGVIERVVNLLRVDGYLRERI
jgi:hypothetical protein